MAEPLQAPLSGKIRADVPAIGTAGNDGNFPIGVMPYAATITKVTFIAAATLTGATTNNRTLNVIDVGAAGSGTTVVASKIFANTVNATAEVPCDITLSATAANLVVAAGDVLEWNSVHNASGLADPGGTVTVEYTRL